MQLVNLYDYNQYCKPQFRFVGVSKKSYHLCPMLLATLPESFWIPPPATDPIIYRQYKSITNELNKFMEAAAEHDLDNILGSERRPVFADSTAGVSLSGLTETAGIEPQALLNSQLDSVIGSDIKRDDSAALGRSMIGEGETPSESSCHPIDVVDLTPPTMVIQREIL